MKRRATIVLLAATTLAIASCNEQSASNAPAGGPGGTRGPIEVGVITLQPQSAPQTIELLGRVTPLATADVRPQVNGIITEVSFQEGRPVKVGDVLYKVNDASFKAALDAATANVSKAQATVAAAQLVLNRNATLLKTNAVSTQTVDDARTALLQAQADQQAASANQEAAQIDLDNATIKAPLDGLIGKSAVSIGSLVTANQTTAMATIRTVDPIYVDLVDTSANMLRIRAQLESGRLGQPAGEKPFSAPVNLKLENGVAYDQKGAMTAAEMVISETTGTFSLRAQFPNPKLLLAPGMFVRASVDLGSLSDIYLVPQRSVSRNTKGEATAYFVGADGKAESRVLQTTASTATQWIVTDGINPGDKVIVDGLQKVTPGAAVKAVDVQIGDDGVIKQQIDATPDASTAKAAQ